MFRRSALAVLALGLALAYGGTSPARAASSVYSDAKRGFSTRFPETMKQVPPKPTGDPSYQAVQYYDDRAKYRGSGSTNPEFTITWWVTKKDLPKPASTPGSATGDGWKPGDGPPDTPPAHDEEGFGMGGRTFEDVLDFLIGNNTNLFGSNKPPMRERWETAKTDKTTKQKIAFQYLEINATKPKKKDDFQPAWYLFVAKLKIERPTESIVVGFQGHCAFEFAKDLGPAYLSIVRNFETTDASNAKEEEVPDDPDKFRDYIKRKKVITGWKYMDSPKRQYMVLYNEAVKEDLIKDIGSQIEAIRAQIYEKLFPPDKPVTAVSVIRVCKDPEEYRAYGGSGGSAGYWSWPNRELVFYKDERNPKDALRVLYHEAFHQYIFYSVGALAPHSWFNEGHGDFFSGHDWKGGHFERGEFSWRKDLAASLKREKRAAPLKDWLTWDQREYYGTNNGGLQGGENYALGWNFIYFLRTSKNPAYQGFLETYFKTLKGCVTAAREERRKARELAKEAGQESAEDEALANMMSEDQWRAKALEAALKGVDLAQLEKDWLAF